MVVAAINMQSALGYSAVISGLCDAGMTRPTGSPAPGTNTCVRGPSMELVEVVQRTVRRRVQVWMFAQEPVDRLADSGLFAGHRMRSFPWLAVAGGSAWWCSVPGICGGWAGRKAAASSAPARAMAAATMQPTLRPWSKALVAAWCTAAAAALWP